MNSIAIRPIFLAFLSNFFIVGICNAQDTETASRKIAPSADKICPIKVGSSVPSVNLTTASGDAFDLNAALGEKPTILIFYRGGWCPYCNRQLGQLRKIHTDLIQMGYQIVAVSADRPEKLRDSIEKDSIDYLLLSDSSMQAASAFGIAFRVDEKAVERYKKINMDLEEASGKKHHVLPAPAAFVIGTDAVIKFAYVNPNYKERVNPDVLLTAARTALPSKLQ